MRCWLARLSFSFFIIAFVLGWQAYNATHSTAINDTGPPGTRTRVALYVIGAVAAFALGLAGVRERHRPG